MNFFEDPLQRLRAAGSADQAARLANFLCQEAFGLKAVSRLWFAQTQDAGVAAAYLHFVGQPATAVAASPHLHTGAPREEVHSGTNPLGVLVVGKWFCCCQAHQVRSIRRGTPRLTMDYGAFDPHQSRPGRIGSVGQTRRWLTFLNSNQSGAPLNSNQSGAPGTGLGVGRE